jgi:S1-C subfamily serine protease
MFKDVDKNKWYAKDVEEAAKLGLMMGTGKDKFEPEKTLTRAELAAVAVRLYKATNEDFVEVIESVLPSVVQIENNLAGSLGSGTFIHPEGFILTNAHVVTKVERDEEGNITDVKVPNMVGIRSPEKVIAGTTYAMGPVLAYDIEKDLAIVKPQMGEERNDYPAIKISSYTPVQSEKVLAIGSPLGLIRSVAEGVVSAYRRMSENWYIQTEAEINPGNSGGCLVNLRGEMIGVPSMKLVSVAVEGLNFAIAMPTVEEFIKEQVRKGKLPGKLLEVF